MGSRYLRSLLAAFGLTILLGLAFGAVTATATTVEIFENEFGPSALDIDDPDDDADNVNVAVSGANVVVTDNGPGGVTPAGTDCTAVNPTTVTCPLDPPDDPPPAAPFLPIGEIEIDLEAGNDRFATATAFRTFGDTDSGDDVFNGSSGDDSVFLGDGNDQGNGLGGGDFIDGGLGNDALDGGEGDDDLEDGGFGLVSGGNDTLTGGPGFDFADYFRDVTVNVSLDKVANDGIAGETDNVDVEGFNGGEGDDTLTGDESANDIFGNEGNDTILTFGGSDEVGGGSGDDSLDGGTGADEVFCGSGIDLALQDPFDDVSFDCERTGADVTFDTAVVSRKGVAKVPVTCGDTETTDCAGKLELTLNGKRVAKGKFDVAPGDTKRAKAKLSKSGKKSLKRNGGTILVKAEAITDTPLGKSRTVDDVLLQQKKGGGKKGGGKKGGGGK